MLLVMTNGSNPRWCCILEHSENIVCAEEDLCRAVFVSVISNRPKVTSQEVVTEITKKFS